MKDEWLSEKQLRIKTQYNLPRSDHNAKLVPNLLNKKEYVVDFRNLKFYLKHGMVLRKVHAVIKYRQSNWMAAYIALNQKKRVEAKTKFEKDFFKLMNNSVFGKTCENQKKRTSIYLGNTREKFKKLLFKPNFMDVHILPQLNFKKPNYFSINRFSYDLVFATSQSSICNGTELFIFIN